MSCNTEENIGVVQAGLVKQVCNTDIHLAVQKQFILELVKNYDFYTLPDGVSAKELMQQSIDGISIPATSIRCFPTAYLCLIQPFGLSIDLCFSRVLQATNMMIEPTKYQSFRFYFEVDEESQIDPPSAWDDLPNLHFLPLLGDSQDTVLNWDPIQFIIYAMANASESILVIPKTSLPPPPTTNEIETLRDTIIQQLTSTVDRIEMIQNHVQRRVSIETNNNVLSFSQTPTPVTYSHIIIQTHPNEQKETNFKVLLGTTNDDSSMEHISSSSRISTTPIQNWIETNVSLARIGKDRALNELANQAKLYGKKLESVTPMFLRSNQRSLLSNRFNISSINTVLSKCHAIANTCFRGIVYSADHFATQVPFIHQYANASHVQFALEESRGTTIRFLSWFSLFEQARLEPKYAPLDSKGNPVSDPQVLQPSFSDTLHLHVQGLHTFIRIQYPLNLMIVYDLALRNHSSNNQEIALQYVKLIWNRNETEANLLQEANELLRSLFVQPL